MPTLLSPPPYAAITQPPAPPAAHGPRDGRKALSFRSLQRAASRHRRPLAAATAALATATALTAIAPAPPPTTRIVTAARDLPGGPLTPADLTTTPMSPTAIPDGALHTIAEAAGRTLTAPARRGEPITDVRLLGPGLLATATTPNTVATPIRLADADAARLLSPGDVVNVLAAPTGWEDAAPAAAAVPAATVADRVTVLTVPPAKTVGQTGALVVLATTQDQAARLATAQTNGRLSITITQRNRFTP
ncbi:Flp pilus assembly protein CpaB [Thermocatellispora tengchongensis]|uniref:Flp pilus assembly protein CpaB n=1 Tax=Thermocatellispora tengchongensis TaxID=1073253 RepID=A0A840PAG3_9ACTN|nr:Flp pilus assembly protein CpaB [Thermocatellispora tengchongensis]MBB5134187.1 Flp pilus assembly protein CpaB [Thermocatellispora tengchongensis]